MAVENRSSSLADQAASQIKTAETIRQVQLGELDRRQADSKGSPPYLKGKNAKSGDKALSAFLEDQDPSRKKAALISFFFGKTAFFGWGSRPVADPNMPPSPKDVKPKPPPKPYDPGVTYDNHNTLGGRIYGTNKERDAVLDRTYNQGGLLSWLSGASAKSDELDAKLKKIEHSRAAKRLPAVGNIPNATVADASRLNFSAGSSMPAPKPKPKGKALEAARPMTPPTSAEQALPTPVVSTRVPGGPEQPNRWAAPELRQSQTVQSPIATSTPRTTGMQAFVDRINAVQSAPTNAPLNYTPRSRPTQVSQQPQSQGSNLPYYLAAGAGGGLAALAAAYIAQRWNRDRDDEQ